MAAATWPGVKTAIHDQSLQVARAIIVQILKPAVDDQAARDASSEPMVGKSRRSPFTRSVKGWPMRSFAKAIFTPRRRLGIRHARHLKSGLAREFPGDGPTFEKGQVDRSNKRAAITINNPRQRQAEGTSRHTGPFAADKSSANGSPLPTRARLPPCVPPW